MKKCKRSIILFLFFGVSCATYLLTREFRVGNTTFGGWDSITQHYPAMLYIRRWLINFFSCILTGEIDKIQLVDLQIGMGEDVISTLNYYGFGDPFYLLTIFFNEDKLPYFFGLLFYVRILLGGIIFIYFVYEMDSERSVFAYVVGALVYTLSGFTLQANWHIIFIHALMYIPLLLLGAERMLKSGKNILFTVSVFLFALSGFYYLYIGSISLAFFMLYRLVIMKTPLRLALKKIFRALIFYCIGLAISGAIFIPSVIGFFNSNRLLVNYELKFFVSLADFKKFFLNAFFPQSNYQVLSLSCIAILCLISYLLGKKKRYMKVILVLCIISANMPIINWIMSGFGACYDRWQIVLILLFSYIVVEEWDELLHISIKQRIGCITLFTLLVIVGKSEGNFDSSKLTIIINCFAILLGFIIIYPIIDQYIHILMQKGTVILLFIISSVMICLGWKENAIGNGIVHVQHRNVVQELVQDDSLYRIDNERAFGKDRTAQNIAMMQEYYGLSEYFSIENSSYTEGLKEWNVSPNAWLNIVNVGVDSRAPLETLCGVKYLLLDAEQNMLVPYGFEKVNETSDKKWILYENIYSIPIVYTYDKVFDENKYSTMNGVGKQDVMLQAVAVKDYNGEIDTIDIIEDNIEQLPFKIVSLKEASLEKNLVTVEPNASLVIQTEFQSDCENYLVFEDIDLSQEIKISASNGIEKTIFPRIGCYNGDLVVNLGTVDKTQAITIEIVFTGFARFSLNSLKTLVYKFDNYGVYVNDLNKDILTDLKIETNKVIGNIFVTEDKILCVSIPYSSGWTAKVDGKKQKIYQANDMFMAIDLKKGEHTIELSYCTPGLKVGMCISLFGVILLIVLDRKSLRLERSC